MDALDPGKFIMWLMAGVLASCWLILLIKSMLPSDWYSAHLSMPHLQQLIAQLLCPACAQPDKTRATALETCNMWSFSGVSGITSCVNSLRGAQPCTAMALRRKSSLVPGCQALRPVQSKPRHCFMVDMKVLQLCSGCGNPSGAIR